MKEHALLPGNSYLERPKINMPIVGDYLHGYEILGATCKDPAGNSAVQELLQPLIDAPKTSTQDLAFGRLPLLS